MLENFISRLPSYIISLPVILLALSVHEAAHGYVAYKLGDPTARNLGRITLNPLKHLNPIGFLMMLFFHVGFANPVPINSRNFKNPRRDMALSSLAGPVSNLLMALISAVVLRLLLLLGGEIMQEDFLAIYKGYMTQSAYSLSYIGTILSILIFMAELSVSMNIGLAIFNLIPIPPLDGSRILYVFLPPKWYFGIMKYEQIIMIVMLALLWFGMLDTPLYLAREGISSLLYSLTGMGHGSEAGSYLNLIQYHIYSLLV
jgi:Zn-dependent protease